MFTIGRPTVNFIAIILVLIGVLNAQSYKRGISFGLNSTYFQYRETPEFWDQTNRFLFNISLFLELSINAKLSVRPSLRFVRLGNHVEFDTKNYPILIATDSEVTQTYLTIPLYFKYLILPQPNIYLLFGPEVGYLIKATTKTRFIDDSEEREEITSKIKRINFDISIGIGAELKYIKENVVFFEIKYAYGITGVPKESEWLYDWKTRELCFSLGIKF